MPAAGWRYGADTVTIVLSAFHGRVATVQGPIGCYRLHSGGNRRSGVLGNVNRSLAIALRRTDERRRAVEAWGAQRTGIDWTDEQLTLPWDWRARALSWRLQREDHPYPHDDRRSIARGLDQSLAAWPGYTAVERLLQRAWVRFMLIAPRWCVAALASSNAPGGWRARINCCAEPRPHEPVARARGLHRDRRAARYWRRPGWPRRCRSVAPPPNCGGSIR
jgi:hypothetical protein